MTQSKAVFFFFVAHLGRHMLAEVSDAGILGDEIHVWKSIHQLFGWPCSLLNDEQMVATCRNKVGVIHTNQFDND